MPRNIQLIGLDLDNTTLNAKKQITPRVRQAIQHAIESGITVLPATGRPLSGITPQFLSIPGVRFALCANGAKVYDLAEGEKEIFSDCFACETAAKLAEACTAFDNLTTAFIGGKAYGQCYDFSRLEAVYPLPVLEYLRSTRIIVPNLVETIRQIDNEVEKFSLSFPNPDERRRALHYFSADRQVTVTWSMDINLELNTATANKGAALLALGRKLGIPREGVMAVGDSSNDLEMLRAAGYSVAMGNASAEVLAAADYVTLTAEDEGVAAIIEQVTAAQP